MAPRVKVRDLKPGMKTPRWVCVCGHCQELFMGYHGAVYCSDACAKAADKRINITN